MPPKKKNQQMNKQPLSATLLVQAPTPLDQPKTDFSRILPSLIADFDSPDSDTSFTALWRFQKFIEFDASLDLPVPMTDYETKELIDFEVIPKLITLCYKNDSNFFLIHSALSFTIVRLPSGSYIAAKAGAIPLLAKLLDRGNEISISALGILSLILDLEDPTMLTELISCNPIPPMLKMLKIEIDAQREISLTLVPLISILCRFLTIEPHIPEITDIITIFCSYITCHDSNQSNDRIKNIESILDQFVFLSNHDFQEHSITPMTQSRLEIMKFLSENVIVPIISLIPIEPLLLLPADVLRCLFQVSSCRITVANTLSKVPFIPIISKYISHPNQFTRYVCIDTISRYISTPALPAVKQAIPPEILTQIANECFKPQESGFVLTGIEIFNHKLFRVLEAFDLNDGDEVDNILSVQELYLIAAQFITHSQKGISERCLRMARYLLLIRQWQRQMARVVWEYEGRDRLDFDPSCTTTQENVSNNELSLLGTCSAHQHQHLSPPNQKRNLNSKVDFGSLLVAALPTLFQRMNEATKTSQNGPIWQTTIFYGVLELLIADLGFCYHCVGEMLYLERSADDWDNSSGGGSFKLSLQCPVPQDLEQNVARSSTNETRA